MIRFNEITSYNLKEFISPSDFSNINRLRISEANSLDHELKKAEIVTKLLHSGINILVEPILLDKSIGRPDILVLDSMPMIAYEIVISESELSLKNKEKNYPFKIIVVR